MKSLGLSCRCVTNASCNHRICSAVLIVANSKSQHVTRVRQENLGAWFAHSTSMQIVKTMPAKGNVSRLNVSIMSAWVARRRHTIGYPGKDRPHQLHGIERRITLTLVAGWHQWEKHDVF